MEAVEILLQHEEKTHVAGQPYVMQNIIIICPIIIHIEILIVFYLTHYLTTFLELGVGGQVLVNIYTGYNTSCVGRSQEQLRDHQNTVGQRSEPANAA